MQVCIPTIPFSVAYLAGSTVLGASPALNCFVATFIFLVCMSQQFHAWGHMKKSQLSKPVIALQVCILTGFECSVVQTMTSIVGNPLGLSFTV